MMALPLYVSSARLQRRRDACILITDFAALCVSWTTLTGGFHRPTSSSSLGNARDMTAILYAIPHITRGGGRRKRRAAVVMSAKIENETEKKHASLFATRVPIDYEFRVRVWPLRDKSANRSQVEQRQRREPPRKL